MGSVQTTPGVPDTQAGVSFGELLVSKGLLTREQLMEALNQQRSQGGRLGEVLLQLKLLDDKGVTAALAEHFSMEYIHLDDSSQIEKIDRDVARTLPESIAKRFCLVVVAEEDNHVVVAMADPLNVVAIDTVTLKLKRPIRPAISSSREIQRAIEMIYHGSDVEEQQLRNLVDIEVSGSEKEDDILL